MIAALGADQGVVDDVGTESKGSQSACHLPLCGAADGIERMTYASRARSVV
jgi:hypothetical protein